MTSVRLEQCNTQRHTRSRTSLVCHVHQGLICKSWSDLGLPECILPCHLLLRLSIPPSLYSCVTKELNKDRPPSTSISQSSKDYRSVSKIMVKNGGIEEWKKDVFCSSKKKSSSDCSMDVIDGFLMYFIPLQLVHLGASDSLLWVNHDDIQLCSLVTS